MALVLQDRVRELSTSVGTGTFTLSGAYVGYRTFASCVPNGSIVYYTINNTAPGVTEWEVGYGTYSSNTLTRTSIYSSTNAGSIVTFSAGDKEVFITYPAEQAVYQQENGDTVLNEGVLTVLGPNVSSYTTLDNSIAQYFANQNNYAQLNMQNQSSGNLASSDYIATANDGTSTTKYVDLGINGSGFADPDALFTIVGAEGAYLYASDGELAIGTANTQPIKFFVDGTLLASEVGRFSSDGNFILYSGASPTDNGQKLQVVGNAAITGAATFGSTVTLSTNPSTALEAATKQYVDSATSTGIHIHTPCTAETSAALSAVYTQGGTTFNITDITGTNTVVTSTTHGLSVNDEIWLTTTAGNGLAINTPYFVYATPTTTSLQLSTSYGGALLTGLTNASGLSYATRANSGVGAYLEASANQVLPIAGVIVGDRVLVYQQATGYWNGVYTVTSLGSVGSKWKLTRATDADYYSPADTNGLSEGDYFFIQSNSEAYVLTTPGSIIIGYTGITYTLFSSVPVYSGTAPINVTGTTISLDVVPTTLGGTNLSSYTTGDMLYASGTDVLAKRAVGNTGNILNVTGGVPTWGTLDLSSANAVSSTLGSTHGGTGQSTYTTGDIIYASASNTLSKLAGQTTTTKKYLQQQGAAADISGLAPSATTDTTNADNITSGTLPSGRITGSYTGLTGTGNLTTGTWSANVISATYGGTGVGGSLTGIPYANGSSPYTGATGAQVVTLIGTNAVANATYAVTAGAATNVANGTAGAIPYQTGSSATTFLSIGGNGTILTSNGTAPVWTAASSITANVATYVATTDDTSTATAVYPVWVGASSGNNAIKVSSTKITFTPSTGVLQATTFSGSGASLTNINGSNVSSGTVGISYGGTGQTTANAAFNALAPSQTGNSGKFLTTDGSNSSWGTVSVSAAGSSTQIQYNNGGAFAASANLTFDSTTNQFTAPNVVASNGLVVNNMTVGSSFSVPSGYSASSVGPITVGSGATVTLPSGSRWVVL